MTGTGAAAEPTTPSQGGKVFVGNLAFKTRSPGLKEAFEKIGPVQHVRVVTQGRRSLGYGFVLFQNPEDAQKAVTEFHRSSLDGREINVEVSTSPNTTPASPAASSNGAPAAQGGAASSPKKTFKRKRTFKKKPAEGGDATPTGDAKPAQDSNAEKPKQNRKRKIKPREPKEPREPRQPRENSEPAQPREPKQPREPRAPRAPRAPREPKQPRENSETSSTVVYVSNLPFSLTDDALKAEFADLGAVSANIIRRKRNDQSKGFGFVEFGTEAQQTAAIEAKHKSKVQDREISVRKAYIRPEPTATSDAAPAPKSE